MRKQVKIVIAAPSKLPEISEERIRVKATPKNGSPYKMVKKENKTPFEVVRCENTLEYLPGSSLSERQVRQAIARGYEVKLEKKERRY